MKESSLIRALHSAKASDMPEIMLKSITGKRLTKLGSGNSKMQILCQIIEFMVNMFQNGMEVERSAWESLETMAGCLAPADLAGLLADPGWEEGETALELLLFPDQESKDRIEALLNGNCLTREDQAAVIEGLSRKVDKVHLLLPQAPGPVMIEVGAGALGSYVARFNLTTVIPEYLVRAACQRLDEEMGLRSLALVRSSGIAWNDALVSLAEKILKNNRGGQEFISFFKNALLLLREIPAARDPEEYLEEKRTWCLFHLDKARSEERELAGQNMETRLLSGVRTAYADFHRLHGQIALIDRILYGMPPLPEGVTGSGLDN